MSSIGGGRRYRIRNARWPEYFLYASDHGPLTASSWFSGNSRFQWTLKSPPDSDVNRPASYLIHSARWRDAVLMVEERTVCTTHDYCNHGCHYHNGYHHCHNSETVEMLENYTLDPNNTNMSLPEGYFYANDTMPSDPAAYDDPENFEQLDLDREDGEGRRLCVYTTCQRVRYPVTRYVQGNWLKWGTDPPITALMNQFERVPSVHLRSPDDQLVMIKNVHNSYLYMSAYGFWGFAGWGTRAYPEDPGAGGYWYFDPPLPQEVWDAMPTYSGRTCDFDCGEVGDIRFINSAQSLTLGFAALISLGTTLAMVQ